MKCPERKKAVNEKRKENEANTGKKQQQTYSQTVKTNIYQNTTMDAETPTKILTCIIHAHMANIGNPGSYNEELNKMLKANNLPTINAPTNPDSASIFKIPLAPQTSKQNQKEQTSNKEDSTRKQTKEQQATTEKEKKLSASKQIRGKDIGLEINILDTEEHKVEKDNTSNFRHHIDQGIMKVTYTAQYLKEDNFYRLLYENEIECSSAFKIVDKSTFKKIRAGKTEERSPANRDPRTRKLYQ